MGLGAGSWGSWGGSWTGSWTGSWRESLARDSKQSKKYIHEPSWREVELCDFLNEWRCSSSSLISSKARGAHRRGERPGRVGVVFIKTLFSFSILFKSVRFTRAERWAVLADVIAGFSIFINSFQKNIRAERKVSVSLKMASCWSIRRLTNLIQSPISRSARSEGSDAGVRIREGAKTIAKLLARKRIWGGC